MKQEVVIVEEMINANVEKVWQILTDSGGIKNWTFDKADFNALPGFEFKLSSETNGKQSIVSCKVLQSLPYHALAYTWSFDEAPYDTIVTFELFSRGDKTKVRLTHEGLQYIPSEHEDYSYENFKSGWTEILGKALKAKAEQN